MRFTRIAAIALPLLCAAPAYLAFQGQDQHPVPDYYKTEAEAKPFPATMDPAGFKDPGVRRAYQTARDIPRAGAAALLLLLPAERPQRTTVMSPRRPLSRLNDLSQGGSPCKQAPQGGQEAGRNPGGHHPRRLAVRAGEVAGEGVAWRCCRMIERRSIRREFHMRLVNRSVE